MVINGFSKVLQDAVLTMNDVGISENNSLNLFHHDIKCFDQTVSFDDIWDLMKFNESWMTKMCTHYVSCLFELSFLTLFPFLRAESCSIHSKL